MEALHLRTLHLQVDCLAQALPIRNTHLDGIEIEADQETDLTYWTSNQRYSLYLKDMIF